MVPVDPMPSTWILYCLSRGQRDVGGDDLIAIVIALPPVDGSFERWRCDDLCLAPAVASVLNVVNDRLDAGQIEIDQVGNPWSAVRQTNIGALRGVCRGDNGKEGPKERHHSG